MSHPFNPYDKEKHPILQDIDHLEASISRLQNQVCDIDDEKDALLDKIVLLVIKRDAVKKDIDELMTRKVAKEIEAEKLGVQNW